jgi:uncharacterized protein
MPASAGLGFRFQHFAEAAAETADGMWFEVHPENYFVDGGPRLAMLEALRTRHPLSLHGVGLSLGSDSAPDQAHLRRLKALADRFDPFSVSEHLAWSSWQGRYFPDLLPFPRTGKTLARFAANVSRMQDTLGRKVLIENPSHYLALDEHDWSETDFLRELAKRTGCGLLLDINNVHVSANNLRLDACAYLDGFPGDAVEEIHLAGHVEDKKLGPALLIDTHGAPVSEPVWQLYAHFVRRVGPRPTLIERDDAIPAFAELMTERSRAAAILKQSPIGLDHSGKQTDPAGEACHV